MRAGRNWRFVQTARSRESHAREDKTTARRHESVIFGSVRRGGQTAVNRSQAADGRRGDEFHNKGLQKGCE